MSDDVARRALDDTFVYLADLARQAVRPDEAIARLASLRARHPDLGIELVWEEQPYANAVHYDALLSVAGGDTASLSVCPTSDTPWPLRGARLTSDHDLLRVNGETMRVDEAMGIIDFIWDDARVVRRLVEFSLVNAELRRRALTPSPADLQRAIDEFRRARGLVTAAATHEWLDAQGISHARLEQLVESQAQLFALRRAVAAEIGVETHWAAHPGAFDVARVSRLRVRDRERAERLSGELRCGREFYTAVENEFAGGRALDIRGGMLAVLRRHEMSAALASAVFAAAPGDVVGPIDGNGHYDIVRVIHTEPATLDDDDTRDAVVDAIFEQWLADRRRAAKVEWLWGPAEPDEPVATS